MQKQAEKRVRGTKLYSREGSCQIKGCESHIKARLLCEKHYAQKRRGKLLESVGE